MTVSVFSIHIRIVIDEVFITCIIGRIDIDDVNLSLVCIAEGGECFQIVTLYEDVVGSLFEWICNPLAMSISICNALIGLKILILATVGFQIRLNNARNYRLVLHFTQDGQLVA